MVPLYEYKCECGKTFDAIQGINEDKLKLCRNMCEEPKKVQRLISIPTIFSDDIGRGSKRMSDEEIRKDLKLDEMD